MAYSEFSVLVSDLVGHPGARRDVELMGGLDIDLAHARSNAPARVTARLDATTDGLVATGSVTAEVVLVCTRCLTETAEERTISFTQVYGFTESEDVEPISTEGMIDLFGTVRDELSLSLPLVPRCRPDCRGLCPTCGTDLNTGTCSGHPDAPESPFAALRDLLDSES